MVGLDHTLRRTLLFLPCLQVLDTRYDGRGSPIASVGSRAHDTAEFAFYLYAVDGALAGFAVGVSGSIPRCTKILGGLAVGRRLLSVLTGLVGWQRQSLSS